MTISEFELQDINLEIEEAWGNAQNLIDSGAVDVATLDKMVSAQQGLGQAAIRVIADPTKDYDLKIWWIDFCAETATDCTSNMCDDLEAPQAELDSLPYKINSCIEDGFSMNEADFWVSIADKDKFISQNMNQKIVNMLNLLNKKALVFLHANNGVHRGTYYTTRNGSGQYQVAAADFATTEVITKFLYNATVSRIQNPFILDGSNLWMTVTTAQLNNGNDNGKGDAARTQLFGMITKDPLGFSKVPAVTASTFVVSPNAYKFATKNYIKNTVPKFDEAANKWKYSIDLGRYGARIDVFMQRVCVDASKDLYKYVWKFKLHYDFFLNPLGCADGDGGKVSGIIEYTKV